MILLSSEIPSSLLLSAPGQIRVLSNLNYTGVYDYNCYGLLVGDLVGGEKGNFK